MSPEEQWSFWSAMNTDVARKLAESEKRRDYQIQTLDTKLDQILLRTNDIHAALRAQPSSLVDSSGGDRPEMPTATMSVTALCWIHRILTEGQRLPEADRGRFRMVQVWIGQADSTLDSATFTPPPAEQVPALVTSLLRDWNERYEQLRGAGRPQVIAALAELHHGLLRIHPFLDSNGRVARCILDQAARELLNQGIGPTFVSPPAEYYSTLQATDKGNYRPLIQRITASLV